MVTRNVSVEVEGHNFEIAIHENYFELHVGVLSDSKENVKRTSLAVVRGASGGVTHVTWSGDPRYRERYGAGLSM
jgi:hypothetical protein